VGHLRRKLAAAGREGVIETIRGRGYMMRINDSEDHQAA
jgi:DNA-binding response OmpR family regulator